MMQPKDKLETKMAWVKDFTPTQVKALGALEVLAAIGLAAPLIFDIAPILVPLAATGLVLMMIGAIVTHARLKEYPMIAMNVVLGAVAVVVAVWGYGSLI